jgi:IS1 family transposase
LLKEHGSAWIMVAFDPVNKVVVAFVVGKRSQKDADLLVKTVKKKTDSNIPHFTSDELDLYEKAILKVYGTRKGIKQIAVSPGNKAPKRLPLPDLIYTRVVKIRLNHRIIGVGTEVVFGEKNAAMQAIARSPVSSHINMAFIERNNLTIRERNRRLTRKTLGFSKKKKLLVSSLNIYFGIYHFVKTHKGLRTKIDQQERKWVQRTPMMAAGITDHVWTLSELINFKVENI